MDRNEAVLRELNLYPLWKRRGAPAPDVVHEAESVVETAAYPINPDSSLEPAAQSLPPERGKARMGVEQRENQVSTPSLTLMEPLAIRLSPQAGKSLVIPLQGRGNLALNELSGKNLRGELGNLDWTELKQQVRDCTACKLRAGCTQTVFGVGDEQAEWLFVGEGPGADEDAQGEPFVGQAGKLLDNMLLAIKLRRGNNVYIANIVKCRQPNNRA
ncbi:MAG: uracil-DNA glycosylase, partial [Gallionella sp.]|nr:uracil-DNA glycosylase [Gallionella sp.]